MLPADKPCCAWIADLLMRAYHDGEWGVPLHDDRKHFEFLLLDGAQAGLSWATVLKKREGYRRAFAGFDPRRVARFDRRRVRAFLEKSVYNAPFGLLVTRDDDAAVLDPRIIPISLSSFLWLK